MRYQFIQEHHGQFQMTVLLRVLGISASAFYQWQKRPVSQRARQKELLVGQISQLFAQNKERYGSPRIHRDLQALGIKCSQKRVARLMKEQKLVTRKLRRFVTTTNSGHTFRVAQNLLSRTCSIVPIRWRRWRD
jgi:transposase InsO family protein